MRYVTNSKNEPVVISRSGEVLIYDDSNRERERHKLPYGSTLSVIDGDVVKAGDPLANWDALTRPIISEYSGTAHLENVEEGVTVMRQIDEVTSVSTLVITNASKSSSVNKGVRPVVSLKDDDGNEVKIQDPSCRSNKFRNGLLLLSDGQKITKGEVLLIPNNHNKRYVWRPSEDLLNCLRHVPRRMQVAGNGYSIFW